MARELKYADQATQIMIKRAAEQNIQTVWDRWDAQQPQCGFARWACAAGTAAWVPAASTPSAMGRRRGPAEPPRTRSPPGIWCA